MVDYKSIADRISVVAGSNVLGVVGRDDANYPLYSIEIGRGKSCLISGGLHGHEPTGPFAIMHFIENYMSDYLDRFRFTFMPCLNPYGIEKAEQENAEGLNLNRQFGDNISSAEMNLLLPIFRRYEFALDLHETWPDEDAIPADTETPREFYLWETCRDDSARIGKKITGQIEKAGLYVCKWPLIFGEPSSEGVISYPEGCREPEYANGDSLDAFLFRNFAKRTFTVEIPGGWKWNEKIPASMVTIMTILNSEAYR